MIRRAARMLPSGSKRKVVPGIACSLIFSLALPGCTKKLENQVGELGGRVASLEKESRKMVASAAELQAQVELLRADIKEMAEPLRRTASRVEELTGSGPDTLARIVPPGARVQKLAGGMRFTEGPVWTNADGGYLVFSDIPADELKKWTPAGGLTTFRKPSQKANGNTRDAAGRLLTCEHFGRRVTRLEPDGTLTVLVDRYRGKRLNSPNDLVVKSDGTIWFTDPPYGLRRRRKELQGNFVFRFDPKSKALNVVADDFDRPNGLCFSPDEKKLYIADAGTPKHIRVFDVQPDGTLSGGQVFCKIDRGTPDGIRCDRQGRLFSSAKDGVQIFAPDGRLIGKIPVPEAPANLCFGGPDGKTLFITARKSLYSIQLKVRGADPRR